jgi:uncharacterized protein
MKIQRELLEKQRAEHLENAQRTKSYLRELTDMSAKCGTDESCFHDELMKAQNDSQYYEEEAERISELLEEKSSHATFWVLKDASGEWRWQLRAANNKIIADSGEGYHHKDDCLHGIELVKDAASVPVKEKS